MDRAVASHRPRATMIALTALKKTMQIPSLKSVPATGFGLPKVAWLGAVFAVLGTGAFFRLHSSSEFTATPSQSQTALRQVSVTTPERVSAGDLTLPATIQAYQATDLFARANGYLRTWNFDIGAKVKAGQVLAEIETPELDQELAQAIALLKQGEAEHIQSVAELEEAKADVALAEANVVKAKANVDFAMSQANRYQTLHNSRAVAREEFEGIVRDRDARKAELESTKAELTRKKSNLSTRQAIIESRRAAVSNRKANVQRLRDLTGFQKVIAPFDGIITRRTAEVGMLVTSGSNSGTKPLFSIAQTDILRVQASVPQSSALGIKTGDPVQITVPEKPGQVFTAKVARTAGAVEPRSRSLLVEVELPNREGVLLPGLYAQIRFQTPQNQASWTIPAKSLLMRSEGPHVVIVTSDDSVRIQKVTLGRDFGSTVEVPFGLHGNERLVVNPSDDLHDGQKVQINGGNERGQLAQR